MTNKCYNGRLYPCQCLEFGYLIRSASSSFKLVSNKASVTVSLILGRSHIQLYVAGLTGMDGCRGLKFKI